MLADRPRLQGLAVACLCLAFAVLPAAQAPQSPPAARQAPAAAALSPEDQRAITDLVVSLYDARARKDAQAYASLWSPRSPRRISVSYPTAYLFPFYSLKPGPVAVLRGQLEGDTTARVQVAATVTVAETSAESPRQVVWVRDMGLVKEEAGWRVWTEVPAATELARQIGQATTEEERLQLLKQNPQVVNEELAIAIEGQGDVQFQFSNYKGATALYELEGRVAASVKSVIGLARSELKIGQVSQLTGAATAIVVEHLKKALDGFTALGDKVRMATAETGLGTAYYMKDDQAARQHYKAAVDILEGLNDRFTLANALHGYGNALFLIGDFGTAVDAYNRAIDILQKAGSTAGVPALRQAMGRVQREQGDYDAAVESYKQSLEKFDTLDLGTQWGGLKGLGDVYRAQGRFDFALEQYNRVLHAAEALYDKDTRAGGAALAKGDAQWMMSLEGDIGNVYMAEQQPGAALEHYQKSLALAQKLENQAGVARALGGAGSAHFSELRFEEALAAFTQALPIHSLLNDKGAMAWTHAHMGLVQAALEKHEDALAAYQRAYDIANALSDAAATAVTMTLLATEHAELDHAEQALDLADRAATAARAIANHDTFAQARVVTARVLRKQGDRDGAERALREAVDAVETGRAQSGEEPREDFFGDARAPYRALALLMAEADKPAEALAFAERSQGGLLADVLTGNRSLITNGLTSAEQEEERRLNRSVKALRVQEKKERERQSPDAARLEGLKTKLTEVDEQRRSFAERAYAAHPALKYQRGFLDTVSPNDVAALLTDSKAAVIEFAMTEKQTLVLLVTRSAPTTAAVAKASTKSPPPAEPAAIQMKVIDVKAVDLSKRIREFRAAVAQKDPEIGKSARELYELLLQPLGDALTGKTRLVIVPDGPLWSLPFQALQDAGGKFLIERCAVSYAPSLTAMAVVQRGVLTGTEVQPAGSTPKGAGLAKVVAVATQQAGSVADRLTLLNPRVSLQPIPNAEQEAKRLAVVYGPTRARVLSGRAATRAAVLGAAGQDALLHLATVFVPSAASPMRSPFVLAAPEKGEDVLEAWELMSRPLPETAVLSRVQVERVGGEGQVPVALAWTLFVGGARTMVLATWPDDSTAAADLMVDLHRNLIAPTAPKPASPSRALRQAILKLLATPQYKHPFYWANYAVLGVG